MRAYFSIIAIYQYKYPVFHPSRGEIGENVMSKLCAYLIFELLNLFLRMASLFSMLRQQYYLLKALLANQPCAYERAPFLSDFMGNV
jgi:hypothetical protein